jgi:hypothetical protein
MLRSKPFGPGIHWYWFNSDKIEVLHEHRVSFRTVDPNKDTNWFSVTSHQERYIAFGTNEENLTIHPISIDDMHWCRMQYNLSQDEIEQLIKELKESYETPKTISVPGFDTSVNQTEPSKPSGCIFHEWVPYTGLKETFEFCKKCGEKKK